MQGDYNEITSPSNTLEQPRILSDDSCGSSCRRHRVYASTKGDRRKTDDSAWMSTSPPTTVPFWSQSIDPRIFSALVASSLPPSTSELANALVMPAIDKGVHPSQTDSGSVPETVQTDGATEGRVQPEDNQLRVCSVRACKQTVPVDYEYKMCPACRVRYQKYGTTKRAKWKVVREKEKQKACGITLNSEAPRPPSDPIQDAGKLNTPLGNPLPETEVHDHTTTTTTPPSRPSMVQPQPLPQMHQPPLCSHPSTSTSSSPNVSFIQEQIPRPPSNPPATGYLESDPIVNGFSKFRVELFEGELDGRYTEGTVINAPHVMKLGDPSKSRTDPPPAPSLQRTAEISTEKVPHDSSGMETPSMTRPIVPVSLTVCHPVTSEFQAVFSGPSQCQNTKDGPSSTSVPPPKSKGKRKAGLRAKATATTSNTPRLPKASGSLPPPNTAPSPQLHLGYPPPHPYPYYPYYPMYFPPYPGAYQYPYLPMPFAAPPSSPSKTKKKKKSAQVADVARFTPTPNPHPGSPYPYPPGPWVYPTPPPPPPPPNTSSLPQESRPSVDPVPQPQSQSPPAPFASSLYTISAPYSLPALHQPSQSPSAPVAHYPHLSGTQPYSGTPLTTLMPVPFFSVGTSAALGSGSRKDKGKEVGKDDVTTGKEPYQIHVQKQPRVQMQFNYYHYGMGTSQSPTTPESHARRKRRKVDPNYREKMEMFRTQGTATAVANPDSTSSSSAPVPPTQGEPQPDFGLIPSKSTTEKQAAGNEKLPAPTLRRCSNKGCTRPLPNIDGNNCKICMKCKTKFKKMTERTKERFRLVPKQTVCDLLGK